METTKRIKDFDCVEMKNAIQAQIYAETRGMSFEELKAYLFVPPEKDPFKKYKTAGTVQHS